MQAVGKKQNEITNSVKIKFEMTDAMTCFQARKKLDALFSGDSLLEESHPAVKKGLFGHLEICQSCCRSFDVNIRFRPLRRDTIY